VVRNLFPTQLAEDLDGGRSLQRTYMVVRNVVQEEASSPSQERSVDGGNCTTEEGPLFATEVGDGWIGVVEVREHDDPVVG
jgi:hypothetical protein